MLSMYERPADRPAGHFACQASKADTEGRTQSYALEVQSLFIVTSWLAT